MAEAAGIGVSLESGDIGQLFGEDQARYLVACTPANAEALAAAAAQAGVPLARVGQFGGATVSLGGDAAPLAGLSALYRSAFAEAVA
jgi:phosphoribosylformylglycinamidine synthase